MRMCRSLSSRNICVIRKGFPRGEGATLPIFIGFEWFRMDECERNALRSICISEEVRHRNLISKIHKDRKQFSKYSPHFF